MFMQYTDIPFRTHAHLRTNAKNFTVHKPQIYFAIWLLMKFYNESHLNENILGLYRFSYWVTNNEQCYLVKEL